MITNLLTSVNKELEELNHQLKDNDYLYDLEERIKIINESTNKTHQVNKELKNEIERLNNIIKEALRKLRATKDHYKIEDINNAIIYTIRILERSDKVE